MACDGGTEGNGSDDELIVQDGFSMRLKVMLHIFVPKPMRLLSSLEIANPPSIPPSLHIFPSHSLSVPGQVDHSVLHRREGHELECFLKSRTGRLAWVFGYTIAQGNTRSIEDIIQLDLES